MEDILSMAASAQQATFGQQSGGVPPGSTTFGQQPLQAPQPMPRFQSPDIQHAKAGNEFQTVSGRKRADKQALFGGIAKVIKAGADYEQAKKSRTLENAFTRLINSQESEQEALQALKANPNDQEAQKALKTARANQNDITTDKKLSKQMQKAMNIDLFGDGKNKQEQAAFTSAMLKWQKEKADADKKGQAQPLNPIAQKMQQSQGMRQQLNPQVMQQIQLIKAGVIPHADEMLKANMEAYKAVSTAKTATDRTAALNRAADLRAEAEVNRIGALVDEGAKNRASREDIASINSRAREKVAAMQAAMWDKRIDILRKQSSNNPVLKSLYQEASTINTEMKSLVEDTKAKQIELDKKGSSFMGIKISAASGADAKIMQNQIETNNLRMQTLKAQLDQTKSKMETLNKMGLLNPNTNTNTPNDAPGGSGDDPEGLFKD